MKTVRIAAAQTFEYRDDIEAAICNAVAIADSAKAKGASLLCFPEAYLRGYLLDAPSAQRVALDVSSPQFAKILCRFPKSGPMLVMGMIESDGANLFNTAAIIKDCQLVGRYRKRHLLKGESVFTPGTDQPVFECDGLRFGINICYDTNFPDGASALAQQKAHVILCAANNMMQRQKAELYKALHNDIRSQRCKESGLWLMSSDVTGQRENRISWGPTAMIEPSGAVASQLPLNEPGLLIFDLPIGS
jgi:predicted amidohydrolase